MKWKNLNEKWKNLNEKKQGWSNSVASESIVNSPFTLVTRRPYCPGRPKEFCFRAVFKWLSKVITWLRLLRLVIGLKDSRQFFNQWEAKPKPIEPCTRDFSRASSELQVIARNCDWLMELFVPVVIGRSNCFGFGFSTVIWKPLYHAKPRNGNHGGEA